MALKEGDIIETAIWMDGRETEADKSRFERDFREKIAEMAMAEGAVVGPVFMTEKKPGEERVPPVPEDIQGPDVKLLVGEAVVMHAEEPIQTGQNFIADLDPKDLERLRKILRRVHQYYNPGNPELSDEKCDEYINLQGPEAALEALREQVGDKVN